MKNTRIESASDVNSLFPHENEYIAQLRQLFGSYEDLLVFAARLMHTESKLVDEVSRLRCVISDHQQAINVFTSNLDRVSAETVSFLLEGLAASGSIGARSILDGIVRQNSRTSKKVVSQRIDQQLKPLWIQHCKDALSAGIGINRLADLFGFNDCSPSFKKFVDERTLKSWAKDAGLVFKPGRPPKTWK